MDHHHFLTLRSLFLALGYCLVLGLTPAIAGDSTSAPHPQDFGFVVNKVTRGGTAATTRNVSPTALPVCASGDVLTNTGAGLVCTTPSSGGGGGGGCGRVCVDDSNHVFCCQ